MGRSFKIPVDDKIKESSRSRNITLGSTEAAQFLFWEYLNRIFFALWPEHEQYRWNTGVVDKPGLGDAGRRMPASKANGAAHQSAN
jgi:hypothetical protein